MDIFIKDVFGQDPGLKYAEECMKRRAGDGRTIKIYINTARIEVPFMWGSLRLAPITGKI